MSDFITGINWIVNTCLTQLWTLICSYWVLAIFALMAILGFIADLVTSTREQ